MSVSSGVSHPLDGSGELLDGRRPGRVYDEHQLVGAGIGERPKAGGHRIGVAFDDVQVGGQGIDREPLGIRQSDDQVRGPLDDTVNTAARMQATGVPGQVQISESAWQRVSQGPYEFASRVVEVKGLGSLTTYLLVEASRPSRGA